MSDIETTSRDAPVAINPSLLCHDCNRFLDESPSGIWTCPSCGITATIQTAAEVIDNGA